MVDQFLRICIPLIFAHLVTDFVLQNTRTIREKNRPLVMIRHGLAAGLISYLVLGSLSGWIIPLGIAVSHTMLDVWKLRSEKGSRLSRFALDQTGHLLILGLFSWAAVHSPQTSMNIWLLVFGKGYLILLAALSGGIISIYVGSFIVELTFDSLGIQGKGISLAENVEAREVSSPRGMVAGGRVIGYLERALIFVFILADYPAGIGFLVAAKSVFRFGELMDSNRRFQAEYIIIGTLLSILFGTVVSYLTVKIIQIILS
jgi:hypothetical protein